MRKDAFNYEQKQEQLLKEIKVQKEKQKLETEEKEFYHKQALDAKRKNKLLKVAIGRLQVQRESDKQQTMLLNEAAANSGDEKDTDTFLTGAKVDDKNNLSNFDSIENSQALVEQHLQSNPHYNRRRGVNQSV